MISYHCGLVVVPIKGALWLKMFGYFILFRLNCIFVSYSFTNA